jgi:hypothetical protein
MNLRWRKKKPTYNQPVEKNKSKGNQSKVLLSQHGEILKIPSVFKMDKLPKPEIIHSLINGIKRL